MKAKEVIKTMMSTGWEVKNVKGSHYHLTHTDHPGLKVQVALHQTELPKKTLHTIKKLTGLNF